MDAVYRVALTTTDLEDMSLEYLLKILLGTSFA